MKNAVPKEVIEAFISYTPDLPEHSAGKITVEPIGGGLINHTYKITSELKPPLLLQQLNKNVFIKPKDVQDNYILISQYAEFEFTGLRLPYPKYINNKESLFIDETGNYWRAFEFIEEGFIYTVADNPLQASAVARTFAKFTAAYSEFNTGLLKTVIPDFHNLSFRYQQFENSLQTEQYERMHKALPLIEELKQRERYKHFYELITESAAEFPQRVMHHDAKITNVLFDKKNKKVICPVDFDTVMPGYFFSDLGDMIRSMVCDKDENSADFDGLSIRKDFYDAILSGYMRGIQDELTASEKKYIHYPGILMLYMQALRFLTDYLTGDLYYHISYPEQNFNRAKNQLILLQKLEEFLLHHYQFKG